MSKRENIPDQRKYSTFPALSTTSSTVPESTPSSLERATDILVCLGNGFNSATEVAAYCDYSVSTVHRLLQNLVELDWVVQDETTHKYFMGPMVTRLAGKVLAAHRYIILHAMKEMSRLANLTEESIILGALDQLHFLKLHEIPSPHNLRIIEASDKLKGQYLGAPIKVLLSQLDDRELKQLFKHIKIERVTTDSVTDTAVIMEQIREIRRTGYSVSYGERIKGAVCISAAVKNYFCPVTLYIVGPEERLKLLTGAYSRELMTSATRISEDIYGVFDGQGGAD